MPIHKIKSWVYESAPGIWHGRGIDFVLTSTSKTGRIHQWDVKRENEIIGSIIYGRDGYGLKVQPSIRLAVYELADIAIFAQQRTHAARSTWMKKAEERYKEFYS